MKTLIIGAGEVGKALFEILKEKHECYLKDIQPLDIEGIEVLHICYPDSEKFIEITKGYLLQYVPKLVIIHSSIKIGTTKKIGSDIVYSPIRGRHPENGLQKEIPAYAKFLSCQNKEKLEMAMRYFKETKLQVAWPPTTNPNDLEFCKLISNVHMGLEIAWRQEVERMIKKFGLCEIIYEAWESDYTFSLKKLGQERLIRSRMNPNPIGGHCILPCTEILKEQFPSKFFDLILESNEKAKNKI